MAPLPGPVSRQNVDQDSDDILQARGDINAFGNMINSIRQYLVDLFGDGGSREQAIANLFQGQAVLFAPGTQMVFVNPTVPAGWIKVPTDIIRHIVVVPGDTGGQAIGASNVWLQTTSTPLIREMLPAINLTGVTDWQGSHSHTHGRQNSQYQGVPEPQVVVQRDDGTTLRAWIYNFGAETSAAGNHYHNITVPLGGAGWGHDHYTYMGNFRPDSLQSVIGRKV